MPVLGLPLVPTPYNSWISLSLFIRANASGVELAFVRDSVGKARDILGGYGIGVAVTPTGTAAGFDEEIGTFTHVGPLFQETVDSYGRSRTAGPGGTTARTEIDGRRGLAGTAVVLFGGASTVHARGYTEFNGRFPYYCMVNVDARIARTTMLHEVGHCADMQHYMARRDLGDSASQDSRNLMAEVPDSIADDRDRLNDMELGLLRRCAFYSATP